MGATAEGEKALIAVRDEIARANQVGQRSLATLKVEVSPLNRNLLSVMERSAFGLPYARCFPRCESSVAGFTRAETS